MKKSKLHLKQTQNIYTRSNAYKKLLYRQTHQLPLRLAFVDIDSTMVGDIPDQHNARKLIEQKGYVLCFITSRTVELVMSWKNRKKSSPTVKNRPKAKLKKNNQNKLIIVDPLKLPIMSDLIDPLIIAATTGVELLVQQKNGGYQYDTIWQQQLKRFGTETAWRNYCFKLIQTFNKIFPNSATSCLPVENIKNYTCGKTSIAPPSYRIQIQFTSWKTKELFKKWLLKQTIFKCKPDWIEESNITQNNYSLYLIPTNINKQTAADQVIHQLAIALNISKTTFELLFIGDSMSDINMGFYAGQRAKTTFLLVGGSHLTTHLFSNTLPVPTYKALKKISRLLQPAQKKGWYTFQQRRQQRTVIVGDIAFPNKIGPQSILALLKNID